MSARQLSRLKPVLSGELLREEFPMEMGLVQQLASEVAE